MVRHQIVMHPLRAACFKSFLLYATRAVLVTLSPSWRPYEPESEIAHPCIFFRSGRQAGRGHEAIPRQGHRTESQGRRHVDARQAGYGEPRGVRRADRSAGAHAREAHTTRSTTDRTRKATEPRQQKKKPTPTTKAER